MTAARRDPDVGASLWFRQQIEDARADHAARTAETSSGLLESPPVSPDDTTDDQAGAA